MTRTEERISELFEELVPESGKADTVAGEIVRAISRIGYRNYNDGDHVGVGYGKETCNPAARYLGKKLDDEGTRLVGELWGVAGDSEYDARLNRLEAHVLLFLERHPELKTEENSEDMWDYRDKDEDVDDEWEDDEDDYDDGWEDDDEEF